MIPSSWHGYVIPLMPGTGSSAMDGALKQGSICYWIHASAGMTPLFTMKQQPGFVGRVRRVAAVTRRF